MIWSTWPEEQADAVVGQALSGSLVRICRSGRRADHGFRSAERLSASVLDGDRKGGFEIRIALRNSCAALSSRITAIPVSGSSGRRLGLVDMLPPGPL
jgi:hypothetical protein